MRLGMVRHFMRLCVLLVAGSTATLAFGQNANTGEIKGLVQDSTGAVVEGVKVTIINVQTGVSIVSATNSAGIYDVPSVPTGLYTVSFSKAGFKEFVRKGVTLEIQTIAVDGTLQVGSINEQMVVVAETPLVETETSDQRVDISTHAIEAAPIVGTDWRAEMIQLIPGVNTGGGAGEANGQAAGSTAHSPTTSFFYRTVGRQPLPEISTAAITTCPLMRLARSASIQPMRLRSMEAASLP